MDQILKNAHRLVAELAPLEPKLLKTHESLESDLNAARDTAKTLGLWAPPMPRKRGGLGLPLTDFAQLSEVLGRSPFGHYACNCQAPDIGNMELLLEHGSPSQQITYLDPLVAGDIRSCFAMTEPENPGSNPLTLSSTAELAGDTYVINGHKWFASSADGAAFAIVMAKTSDGESAYRHFSQIIVPRETPGFEFVRNIPIMGDVGAGYFSHAELRFVDCRVPQTHLIGREGDGFALAQQRLGPGRIHHCMRWIGIAQRALEMMCRRASGRSMGRGDVLADRQVVKHAIADSHAEIQAARLMVLDAADQVQRLGSKGARLAISTIKFYVAGVLNRVLDRAIQVHGGLGMTDDTILSFWYRHERAARIYDGPDEVHKDVVGRLVVRHLTS